MEALKRFLNTVKVILYRYFLTGLLVLVPLFLTIWIFQWGIETLDRWVPATYQPRNLFGFHIPGWGGILIGTIILAAGILTRNIVGRRVVHLAERILGAVPFVRGIYRLFKQVTQAVFSTDEGQFSRVVLVEFPRRGVWTPAFVTGAVRPPELKDRVSERLITLYVPTTPNPTGGYFLMVPESQTVNTNLSVDDAFKLHVSLGMVLPESMDGTGGDLPEPKTTVGAEPMPEKA